MQTPRQVSAVDTSHSHLHPGPSPQLMLEYVTQPPAELGVDMPLDYVEYEGFQPLFLISFYLLSFIVFSLHWLNGEDRNASLAKGRGTGWKRCGTPVDQNPLPRNTQLDCLDILGRLFSS